MTRLREPAHTDIGGQFAGRDSLLGTQPEIGVGHGTRASTSASINPKSAGRSRAATLKKIDRDNAGVQQMRAEHMMDKMF